MPSDSDKQPTQSLLPSKPGIPVWNADDINASLQAILIYVESEANKSINWYWRNKRSKAIYSQIIRFAAYTLTALGGLFPIAVLMLNPLLESMQLRYRIPEKGLASSLFVGVAAGLYGLDKAFGLSSGWTRYVLTATVLEKTLEEFRLQWTLLLAKLSRPPLPDQIEALLKCAQDFRVAVASAVLQETKDWVTEFQNNLGELERDTRAQLETLRAKVEKTRQTESEENRPGAIELLVPDAAGTDGFAFDVSLEGDKDFALNETVRSSKTWAKLGVLPGQYRLTLAGKVGGKDFLVAKIVIVKPDETTALQVHLQV
jgi:hypothetical protein